MRLHNRQIKAGFWTDTGLIQHLSRDERLFYVGLWQLADDSGCLYDDMFALKIQLFPGDMDITPETLRQWRDKLVGLGKLVPYQAEGKRCLYMRNFHKHQTLRSPAPPGVPLPSWVHWIPSEERRRSGSYEVSEPCGNRTVTVRTRYGDQPEPEPEPEAEGTICAPTSAQDTHDDLDGSVEAEHVTATPRRPFRSMIQEQRFDEFWSHYPKKRSKGQAERAWAKITPDDALFRYILDGLERAKRSRDWLKEEGKYIPYPATWLNAKGWEDDYAEVAVSDSEQSRQGYRPYIELDGYDWDRLAR